MKVQVFSEVLSNYVWVYIEELLKSQAHKVNARVSEHTLHKCVASLLEINEVLHGPELLLGQLLVIKHPEALIVDDLLPKGLRVRAVLLQAADERHIPLEVFYLLVCDELTEFLSFVVVLKAHQVLSD